MVLRAREDLGNVFGSVEPYGVILSIWLDALVNDAKTMCCSMSDVLLCSDVCAVEVSVGVAKRNEDYVGKMYWLMVDAVFSFTYW